MRAVLSHGFEAKQQSPFQKLVSLSIQIELWLIRLTAFVLQILYEKNNNMQHRKSKIIMICFSWEAEYWSLCCV